MRSTPTPRTRAAPRWTMARPPASRLTPGPVGTRTRPWAPQPRVAAGPAEGTGPRGRALPTRRPPDAPPLTGRSRPPVGRSPRPMPGTSPRRRPRRVWSMRRSRARRRRRAPVRRRSRARPPGCGCSSRVRWRRRPVRRPSPSGGACAASRRTLPRSRAPPRGSHRPPWQWSRPSSRASCCLPVRRLLHQGHQGVAEHRRPGPPGRDHDRRRGRRRPSPPLSRWEASAGWRRGRASRAHGHTSPPHPFTP